MRYLAAPALVGLAVMIGTPAMAQKHPTDRSVDLPGDNSPSTIERAHPYSRKTVPLPEKAEPPKTAPSNRTDQPLTRLPAANPNPDGPGMSTHHQTMQDQPEQP